MHQVLMCKDYVLIKGYPGTGEFQHNYSCMIFSFYFKQLFLIRLLFDSKQKKIYMSIYHVCGSKITIMNL